MIIGFGRVVDFSIFVILSLLLLGIVLVCTKIAVVILKDIPQRLLSWLFAATLIFGIALNDSTGFSDEQSFIIASLVIIIEIILGASLWSLIRGKARALPIIFLILTVLVNISGLYWLLGSGTVNDKEYNSSISAKIEELTMKSPGEKGKYTIESLTYGTGDDKRRIEYGKNADIITYSVNVKPLLGKIEGFNGKRRKYYWGFNEENFPLNGRVWYPKEEGSFPLVLIVHGNHSMEEWSDDGYRYLGEHLASRGYIAVSVDENFLNGSWSGGVGGENDVRGWMLLKHLELWNGWNNSESSIFYNKVDLDNISLIGHSRGGEAVSIAAAFNKLERYPNDADIKFNFNYNIKSIAAIAPTDGQYKPTGKLTPLENIDYLLIQGSNDGDVSSFYGSRQFNRIKFSDEGYHFKTSLYIGGANHGQFNTSWGRYDLSFPQGLFLNTKSLMDEGEQRRIALVYISAFLDVTLKDAKEFMPMFKNYEYAQNWLPKTVYMNRFEDCNFTVISNYEEDIDIATSSVGGQCRARGMYFWREKGIKLRDNTDTYNSAVYLQWRNARIKGTDTGREASYTVKVSENFNKKTNIDIDSNVIFSAGDTGKEFFHESNNNDKKWFEFWKSKNNTKSDKESRSIDFSVGITDYKGNYSELPINDFGSILPAVKVKFTKLKWLEEGYSKEIEPNFQTVMIPLRAFVEENPELDYENINEIKFIFNRVENGEIILDDIGFIQ
jgi:dienelactone hydrolase